MVDANIFCNFYMFSFLVASALVDTIFNDSLKIEIKLRNDLAST
jgi:hypothetical protein